MFFLFRLLDVPPRGLCRKEAADEPLEEEEEDVGGEEWPEELIFRDSQVPQDISV